MSSHFVLEIGGFEIDSGPRYVVGKFTDLFTPKDRHVRMLDDTKTFKYEITVKELNDRLNECGFTWANTKLAFEKLIEAVSEKIKPEDYVRIDDWGNEKFKKYLSRCSISNALGILYKCKSFGQGFYPDLGTHDFNREELRFVNLLFNNDDFVNIFEDIYFAPLNLYRLLTGVFKPTDQFCVDYTDLVYAGYYKEQDEPIEHGFDSVKASQISGALILGDKIQSDEDEALENKEIKGDSPVSTIKSHLPKYVLGFLNSIGGTIRWGISDNKKIIGVELNEEERDSIRKALYLFLNSIVPPAFRQDINLTFRPIIHDGKQVENLYCVELVIPPSELNSMVFTKGGDTWVRFNGITKELKGIELFNYIRTTYKG